jgi:outer membrane protein assembly factor BamB
MRKAPILVAVAVCVATALTSFPSSAGTTDVNWPQFRFNKRHTGNNPNETTINESNVIFLGPSWQAQLGKLVASSSPAVVDGVVYIGSSDGRLWAYPAGGCGQDLCTEPLWSSTSVAQILSSPTVSKGVVYVGSQTNFNSNNGKLNAFSADGCGALECPPLWQGLAGPDSILESSPAVAKGKVFIGAFDGKLYAFDSGGCGAATCKPLWKGVTGGTIESSPTVVKGVVYIGSDDGNLYAFDAGGCGKVSCDPLWMGPTGGPVFQSTPAVLKGKVYIGSDHALSAFKAGGCGKSSCDPLWQAVDANEFFNGSPAIAGGRVTIGFENGLAVFAAGGCGQATCEALWTDFGTGAQAAVLSSPTLANGVVYAGRNTGEVLAWPANGCGASVCFEIWKGLTGDQIVSSSPTVVNGTVYIGSADNLASEDSQGRIYVWELTA